MRRFLCPSLALALCAAVALAADRPKDTPAAAKTRQRLKTKVTVDYKETRIKDVATDLMSQLDNKISIKIDNNGGVSNNLSVTYSAADKPLDQVLDEMFAKNQLGYVIISDSKDRRDGFLIIKKGRQRGYEETAAAEPSKDKTAKEEEKPKEEKPAKDKKKGKPTKTTDKAVKKDKSAKEKPSREPSGDDSDKLELRAKSKLKLIRNLYEDGVASKDGDLIKKAKMRLGELIHDYPKTKAAEEARELLKKLEK